MIFIMSCVYVTAQSNDFLAPKYIRASVGYRGDYFYSSGKAADPDMNMLLSGGSFGLAFGRSVYDGLTSAVYIEAGVEGSYTFGKYKKSSGDMELLSVGMPVDLCYKVGINDGALFVLYAGFTLKYNAIASYTYNLKSVSFFNKDGMRDTNTANRVQIGALGGLGIEIGSFGIYYKYGYDLTSFQSYQYKGNGAYNNTMTHNVSLTYFFYSW